MKITLSITLTFCLFFCASSQALARCEVYSNPDYKSEPSPSRKENPCLRSSGLIAKSMEDMAHLTGSLEQEQIPEKELAGLRKLFIEVIKAKDNLAQAVELREKKRLEIIKKEGEFFERKKEILTLAAEKESKALSLAQKRDLKNIEKENQKFKLQKARSLNALAEVTEGVTREFVNKAIQAREMGSNYSGFVACINDLLAERASSEEVVLGDSKILGSDKSLRGDLLERGDFAFIDLGQGSRSMKEFYEEFKNEYKNSEEFGRKVNEALEKSVGHIRNEVENRVRRGLPRLTEEQIRAEATSNAKNGVMVQYSNDFRGKLISMLAEGLRAKAAPIPDLSGIDFPAYREKNQDYERMALYLLNLGTQNTWNSYIDHKDKSLIPGDSPLIPVHGMGKTTLHIGLEPPYVRGEARLFFSEESSSDTPSKKLKEEYVEFEPNFEKPTYGKFKRF